MWEDVANEVVKRIPNVVGYSKTLKPKLVKGKPVGIMAIRFYVEKKLPRKIIPEDLLIPLEIEGIPTDVVEVGRIQAPPPFRRRKEENPRTLRWRPLHAGTSVGNVDITAGTLSWFAGNGKYLLSNAHVLCSDPTKPSQPNIAIVQPGPYDKGRFPEDYVADLKEYGRIYLSETESSCPISKAVVKFLNFVSRGLGRKTRFVAILEEKVNHADWAVGEIVRTTFEYNFVTDAIWDPPLDRMRSLGLLFAGSDVVTVVCKFKYIPYKPDKIPVYEPTADDVALLECYKVGRTTGYTHNFLFDDSARVKVWYGAGLAIFEDVILTYAQSKGGDSGSLVWILKDEEGMIV